MMDMKIIEYKDNYYVVSVVVNYYHLSKERTLIKMTEEDETISEIQYFHRHDSIIDQYSLRWSTIDGVVGFDSIIYEKMFNQLMRIKKNW